MEAKSWAHEVKAFTRYKTPDDTEGATNTTAGLQFKNGLYVGGNFSAASLPINTDSVTISGSGGAGYVAFSAQTADPVVALVHLFADSAGRLAIGQSGASGHTAVLDNAVLTAKRVYTMPNKAGTFAMTDDNVSQFTNDAGYLDITDLASYVQGPASAVSGQLPMFNGTTGKLISDSGVAITGGGVISLGGFNLTVPATGTVALLDTANVFTQQNTFAAGIITTSKPTSITQTWNASGVSFTGLLINITNTASAQGSEFARFQVGGTDVFGIGRDGYLVSANFGLRLTAATTDRAFIINTNGLAQRGGAYMAWGSNATDAGGAPDVTLYRDTIGTLALRAATAAQELRIYNTFTTLNTAGEWAVLSWKLNTNTFDIGTKKGSSSGTARSLAFMTDGTERWTIGATTGHVIPVVSNTYDLGDSGTTIRNGYFGTSVVAPTVLASTNLVVRDASTGFLSPATTVVALQNNNAFRSSNYTSGVQGHNIDYLGNAEFNNVRVRGELAASVFKVSEISATAGTLGVFNSAAALHADCTTPASTGSSFSFDAKNSDAGAMLFAVNDVVRFKTWTGAGISDSWATITARTNNTTYTSYTATLNSGSTSATYRAGTAVVDYGPSGAGIITLSADGTVGSSPNLTMAVHAGSPWSAQTLLLRAGNLNGSFGHSTNIYGFGVGQYGSANAWLSFDTTNGIRIGHNTTVLGQWDASGNLRIGQPTLGNIFLGGGGQLDINYNGVTLGSWGSGGITVGEVGATKSNITIDATNGIRLRNNTTVLGQWDVSGNATFGQVGTSKANAYWNASNNRLEFRGSTNGTVVQSYIDSDGSFVSGGGNVTLNASGLSLAVTGSGPSVPAGTTIKWGGVGEIGATDAAIVHLVSIGDSAFFPESGVDLHANVFGQGLFGNGAHLRVDTTSTASYVRAYSTGSSFSGMSIGASTVPTNMLDVYGTGRFVKSTATDLIVEATSAGTFARILFKTADREWRFVNDSTVANQPFGIYDGTAGNYLLNLFGNSVANAVQIRVNSALKTIEVGAADSGGAGYRMLRVLN